MRSVIIFLVICILASSCGFFLGPFFFDGPAAETCPGGICLRHKILITVIMVGFIIGPPLLGEWSRTDKDRQKEKEECNRRGIY